MNLGASPAHEFFEVDVRLNYSQTVLQACSWFDTATDVAHEVVD
ncbi:hypothetical protein AOR01nite_20590 [Acetobacter orleanensis]|uniref:Uncharacterized protein n=1 Tax=Acetobacter orleanensis TaxID=104099 RepID=A0A4Y3TP21_9PROT|nr:hypothetical protein Abol_001_044 [Acetobacter orleanensis JCM 7639]GEB83582.1 hypothetical protein AOR01nite_20590 [Acetobacter orleanensis]